MIYTVYISKRKIPNLIQYILLYIYCTCMTCMYVTVCVIVRENYVRKNINYDAYSLFRDYYCEKILPYHADRTMWFR